jgi:hypothetical protein
MNHSFFSNPPALRPDLMKLKKIIYFHENQLCYPTRFEKDRDFQFGWNQIVSSLCADVLVFNSEYNRSSFFESIVPFLKKKVPSDQILPFNNSSFSILSNLKKKSQIIHFPFDFLKLVKIQNIYMTNYYK